MPRSWPRVQILFAAVLFSTGGAAIKGNELTWWQVASFRCAIAVAALLILIPESRRNWSWRIAPVAITHAVSLVLFVVASKLTAAANAIFLQSTAPAYLALLSPFLLHERIRRRNLLLLAGAGAGLMLLFLGPQTTTATAPDPLVGNIAGALAGFTWALTMAGLRWLGRGESSTNTPAATVVLGNLLAFLAVLPMALPVTAVRWQDMAVIMYLGVFQIALAYLCLTRAIQRVPAFEAATLLLLEPALNPVWAWLVLNENPGPGAIAGGAIIVFATLVNAWQKHHPVDRLRQDSH